MVYDQDQLREEVQVFRIIKPKISSNIQVRGKDLGEYARVVLRLKPGTKANATSEELQEALVSFARRQGWAVFVGTPPKSKKERQLGSCLADFRGDR
jgi:hypothetical protein